MEVLKQLFHLTSQGSIQVPSSEKIETCTCHILLLEITKTLGNVSYKRTYFNLSYTSYGS